MGVWGLVLPLVRCPWNVPGRGPCCPQCQGVSAWPPHPSAHSVTRDTRGLRLPHPARVHAVCASPGLGRTDSVLNPYQPQEMFACSGIYSAACGLRKEWELFFQRGEGHTFPGACHRTEALPRPSQPEGAGSGLVEGLHRVPGPVPGARLAVDSGCLRGWQGNLSKVALFSAPKRPVPTWPAGPSLQPRVTFRRDCGGHSSVGYGN